MNQTICIDCLQPFDDNRPPSDLSLPGGPPTLCPTCWASELAWDDDPHPINKRTYTPEEQSVVSEWDKNWAALSELLIKVFSSETPPDIYDEIDYTNLHFWFLEHEDAFLRVFSDLYEAPVVSAVSVDNDEVQDYEEAVGIEEHHWNPYRHYYPHQNLYELAQENGLLSHADPWEPDKDEVGYMRFDFAVTKAMLDRLQVSTFSENGTL